MQSTAEHEPTNDRQKNQDHEAPHPSRAGSGRWSLLNLYVRHFSPME